MSIKTCKNCNTEIGATNTDPNDQLIICPTCEVVYQATGEGDRLASFKPSDRKLPSKMSVEVLNDELIITRRWIGLLPVALLSITSFMLIFGLFFSEVHTLEFVINPLTWLMFGVWYFSLSRVVNSTVVRITPQHLMVKQGPLPLRRNTHLNAQDIKQLYVKQHVQRNRKGNTTTYQVHLTDRNGQHKELVSGLERPEQALFLEQEIERYLGIKDRSMPGEHESSFDYDFSGWRKFAEANRLQYTSGKLLEGHYVSGHYHGYAVELIAEKPRLNFAIRSRLILAVTEGVSHNKDPQKHISLNDVTQLFATPLRLNLALTGKFKASDEGEEVSYEQDEVETSSSRLQFVFDILFRMIEVYPQIIDLGGEVIPILQPAAIDKKHPGQAVAVQLIREIGPTTEHLHEQGEASLLCPQCLMRCAAHEVVMSWSNSMVYYGCRQCHQSKDFLTIDKVIAVLDNQTDFEPIQQGRTLTVNWLPRQTLFDFDTVKIIKATDEDAERFAVQVGNDTDPVRKPYYKQMQWVVSPDCELSDNTMRILQRTFGQRDF